MATDGLTRLLLDEEIADVGKKIEFAHLPNQLTEAARYLPGMAAYIAEKEGIVHHEAMKKYRKRDAQTVVAIKIDKV
jgi:hypothetical protein